MLTRKSTPGPEDNYCNGSTEDVQLTHHAATVDERRVGKLKRAFVFGHSLGGISQATGVSRGTLSAYAARHNWSRDRGADTIILRKGNGWE